MAYRDWLPQDVARLVVGRRIKFKTKGGADMEGQVSSYEKSWLKVQLEGEGHSTASTRMTYVTWVEGDEQVFVVKLPPPPSSLPSLLSHNS